MYKQLVTVFEYFASSWCHASELIVIVTVAMIMTIQVMRMRKGDTDKKVIRMMFQVTRVKKT